MFHCSQIFSSTPTGQWLKASIACIVLGLLLFGQQAQSLIRIVITSGSRDAIKIAVVPFNQVSGALPDEVDLSETVRSDLSFSGRFSSIRPEDMLEKPSEAKAINFDNWLTQDIPYLVIGRVVSDPSEGPSAQDTDQTPSAYTVEFQIFDVRNQVQMAGYAVSLDQAHWQHTAHAVSRYVYETILQEESFFGQNLIYVKVVRNQQGRKHYSLVLSDIDGEEIKTLYKSVWPIYSPSLSPSGRFLAFVAIVKSNSVIFTLDFSTDRVERVLPGFGAVSAPAWSPDGQRLAFAHHQRGNSEIYLYNLADRGLKRLTYNAAIDTEPVWSTDGDYIFFTSDRAGGVQIYQKAVHYHSRAIRLTYTSRYNASVAVAPNGEEIAFVHRKHNRDRIMVLNINTGLERTISEGDYDESPSYSNNSRMVMFTSGQYENKTISFVDVQSTSQYQFRTGDHSILDAIWAHGSIAEIYR